jgi:hypothetical protein
LVVEEDWPSWSSATDGTARKATIEETRLEPGTSGTRGSRCGGRCRESFVQSEKRFDTLKNSRY